MASVITHIQVREEKSKSGVEYTCAYIWINSHPLNMDVTCEHSVSYLLCLCLDNKNLQIQFCSKKFKDVAIELLKKEKFSSVKVNFY